jgi:nucleotide-binding universal stress UspA family protein
VGWFALYQALGVARREGGRLVGLHVVPDEADKHSEAVQEIKAKFNRRCAKTGIAGRMVVEAGNVTDKIYERSRWSDLIVLRLIYPPSPQPLTRLGSGFHSLARRCRRPILVVPRNFVYPLDRVLLAYDGSPKATEALYIAAYLAGRWETPLVVLTLAEKHIAQDTLQAAQDYLQQFNVPATYLTKEGPVAKTIVETAEEFGSNLIVMGGYGHNPVVEIVLGSAVDEVLRTCRLPTLICR